VHFVNSTVNGPLGLHCKRTSANKIDILGSEHQWIRINTRLIVYHTLTSMPETSGLVHISPVQVDATVATVHLWGQPKPQVGTVPHSASGGIQGLAQRSAIAVSEGHAGGLRNSNLSDCYSTDVTTCAPLPSFLKSARKPRMSTHGERQHGLSSLKYHSSSGSSSVSSITSMGSEGDKKACVERRKRDKQQQVTASRHASDKADKPCGRPRGDRCKVQRSLSHQRIPSDSSSDPSSSDSDQSSSSCFSGGGYQRAFRS